MGCWWWRLTKGMNIRRNLKFKLKEPLQTLRSTLVTHFSTSSLISEISSILAPLKISNNRESKNKSRRNSKCLIKLKKWDKYRSVSIHWTNGRTIFAFCRTPTSIFTRMLSKWCQQQISISRQPLWLKILLKFLSKTQFYWRIDSVSAAFHWKMTLIWKIGQLRLKQLFMKFRWPKRRHRLLSNFSLLKIIRRSKKKRSRRRKRK